jgi:probable phosphoglycerate mutase
MSRPRESGAVSSTLVAVRHGETEWNRTGRMQGWAPIPLNERGRRQARAVGSHLATEYEFDRVVGSDLRRTRETTALIRDAGVGPEPEFEAGWRERGLGRLQGLSRETLFDRHPEFDYANGTLSLSARPPGGESILDTRERVLRAARELFGAGDSVLVVTHGGPIAALIAAVTDDDLLTVKRQGLANCSITEIRGPSLADADLYRANGTV